MFQAWDMLYVHLLNLTILLFGEAEAERDRQLTQCHQVQTLFLIQIQSCFITLPLCLDSLTLNSLSFEKTNNKRNVIGEGLNQVTVQVPSICKRLCSQRSDQGDVKQCYVIRDTILIKVFGCNQQNTCSSFKPHLPKQRYQVAYRKSGGARDSGLEAVPKFTTRTAQ